MFRTLLSITLPSLSQVLSPYQNISWPATNRQSTAFRASSASPGSTIQVTKSDCSWHVAIGITSSTLSHEAGLLPNAVSAGNPSPYLGTSRLPPYIDFSLFNHCFMHQVCALNVTVTRLGKTPTSKRLMLIISKYEDRSSLAMRSLFG